MGWAHVLLLLGKTENRVADETHQLSTCYAAEQLMSFGSCAVLPVHFNVCSRIMQRQRTQGQYMHAILNIL